METKKIKKVILQESTGKIDFPKHFIEQYHTHIYCLNGEFGFTFKGHRYSCVKGEFVFWFADSAVSHFSFSDHFKARVLFVEKEFLDRNLPDLSWSIDVTVHTRRNPILHLTRKKDKKRIEQNFMLLYGKFMDRGHIFYEEVMNRQMQLFILEMWHIFAAEFKRNARTAQSGSLFDQFTHLIQEHCTTQRQVQFYADKLHITAKHLNFIAQQNTEISASGWIQRFVRERLIVLLENKTLGIAEIADKMEFSSRSFFTRYVKKTLDTTPTNYRKRLE